MGRLNPLKGKYRIALGRVFLKGPIQLINNFFRLSDLKTSNQNPMRDSAYLDRDKTTAVKYMSALFCVSSYQIVNLQSLF